MPRRQSRPAGTLAEEAANRYYHLAKLDGGHGKLRAGVLAMKQAADAMATVHGLAVAWRELGRRPSQADYAEYWHLPLRTVERDFAHWRKAFANPAVFPGNELDVYTVAQRIVLEHGELLDQPQQAGLSIPADVLTAH